MALPVRAAAGERTRKNMGRHDTELKRDQGGSNGGSERTEIKTAAKILAAGEEKQPACG